MVKVRLTAAFLQQIDGDMLNGKDRLALSARAWLWSAALEPQPSRRGNLRRCLGCRPCTTFQPPCQSRPRASRQALEMNMVNAPSLADLGRRIAAPFEELAGLFGVKVLASSIYISARTTIQHLALISPGHLLLDGLEGLPRNGLGKVDDLAVLCRVTWPARVWVVACRHLARSPILSSCSCCSLV